VSDKLNLDIFWLKDESLEDSANLPDPDIIANRPEYSCIANFKIQNNVPILVCSL